LEITLTLLDETNVRSSKFRDGRLLGTSGPLEGLEGLFKVALVIAELAEAKSNPCC
jgi:hypothetical protein